MIILAVLGVAGTTATALPRLLASSSVARGASHVSYLRDASPLRPLVSEKIGGDPQVLGLDVYPEYTRIHVAVTPALDAFDTVVVRRGAVQSRAPMVVPPRGAVAPHRVMRLSQVDLSRIPSLAADARTRLGIPGGEVEHVLLSSFVFELPSMPALPPEAARHLNTAPAGSEWRGRPHWTVYVKNERHARGHATYSLDGHPMETIGP